MELKPNERACKMYPVAVKYICEFCGKGEMIVNKDKLSLLGISMKAEHGPMMYPHTCTSCGKEMQLPQPYPKLEWVEKEEYDKIFPENY